MHVYVHKASTRLVIKRLLRDHRQQHPQSSDSPLHIRGRSGGTACDFEHLFSNSVYGHPLHREYPLRSVVVITLPRMNVYIVRSVRAYIRIVDYSRVAS